MSRIRNKKKLTRAERRLKKRITFRTLFLLAITCIFNTYAWFLYVNTVSANLTAHVEAWHVQFEVDDEIVERQFSVAIEHAYPGMANVVKTVTILNNGEKAADLSYAIKSLRIFDNVYVATDQLETGDTIPQGATQTTSANLLNMIQNNYPFTITIASSQNTVNINTEGTLTFTFSWAYESGQDATDTEYGTDAYDFYEDNPGVDAIEIVVKLVVTQHND